MIPVAVFLATEPLAFDDILASNKGQIVANSGKMTIAAKKIAADYATIYSSGNMQPFVTCEIASQINIYITGLRNNTARFVIQALSRNMIVANSGKMTIAAKKIAADYATIYSSGNMQIDATAIFYLRDRQSD
jgi:hypothetical protein